MALALDAFSELDFIYRSVRALASALRTKPNFVFTVLIQNVSGAVHPAKGVGAKLVLGCFLAPVPTAPAVSVADTFKTGFGKAAFRTWISNVFTHKSAWAEVAAEQGPAAHGALAARCVLPRFGFNGRGGDARLAGDDKHAAGDVPYFLGAEQRG